MNQPRQLWALLTTAIKIDFRDRNPMGGRSKSSHAMLLGMVMNTFVGGAAALAGLAMPPWLWITIQFALGSAYVLLSLVVEYQEIILAPTDADVLYWRPISQRTIFWSRLLHILVYVNVLQAAFMLVPCIATVVRAPAAIPVTLAAFVVAAFMNATFTVAIIVLTYGYLIKKVPRARVQDVLTWFQILLVVVFVIGFHSMTPFVTWLEAHPEQTRWAYLLPSHWFAALPGTIGWDANGAGVWLFGLGALSLAVLAVFAAKRLAPGYADDIVSLDTHEEESSISSAASQRRKLRLRFPRWLSRDPISGAGLRFFLQNLNGDRRVKMNLVPIIVMPLTMALVQVLQGQGRNPYVTQLTTSSSAAEGSWAGDFSSVLAVYFLVFFALWTSRALSTSTSWRASWIYHLSPGHYLGRFYRGVLNGALFCMTLPAAFLLFGILSLLWRNPYHAIAHISVPLGLAMIALPLSVFFDPVLPFSQETGRHQGMRGLILTSMYMLPTIGIGVLQLVFRQHIDWFLVAGIFLACMSLFIWKLVERNVVRRILANGFDG